MARYWNCHQKAFSENLCIWHSMFTTTLNHYNGPRTLRCFEGSYDTNSETKILNFYIDMWQWSLWITYFLQGSKILSRAEIMNISLSFYRSITNFVRNPYWPSIIEAKIDIRLHRQTSPNGSCSTSSCACVGPARQKWVALSCNMLWKEVEQLPLGLVCLSVCAIECRFYLPIEGHMAFCQNLD